MDAETSSPKSLTDRTVLAAQAILGGKSRGPGASPKNNTFRGAPSAGKTDEEE